MSTLLPGTQVEARGLPWDVVHSEPAGEQHRFRLRCLQELERTVWDLVVIDEAHHCVRLGSAGDWEDSRRGVKYREADG